MEYRTKEMYIKDIEGRVKVKLSLWVFNWAPCHEGVLGE